MSGVRGPKHFKSDRQRRISVFGFNNSFDGSMIEHLSNAETDVDGDVGGAMVSHIGSIFFEITLALVGHADFCFLL